ncbi:MAG: GNAT family N-acetyltransferase, partial [Candidatus Nanopelagicales bacterium]
MTDGLIRAATKADVPEILALIRDLAEYEREPQAVVATVESLERALFGGSDSPSGSPAVWCLVVEHSADRTENEAAGGQDRSEEQFQLGGIALWFVNFSTWTGTHGAYLEDLFVRPQLRGLGYGQQLLASVAAQCVKYGYARMEWSVLDWNTPAIDFYRRLGAVAMDEWTTFRLAGEPWGGGG